MHSGVLIMLRQALVQYLIYAKPWQRRLIVAGLIGGGPALIALGVVTGTVMPTVVGSILFVTTGCAALRIARGRQARRRSGAHSAESTAGPAV
jgi:hypothetical protein